MHGSDQIRRTVHAARNVPTQLSLGLAGLVDSLVNALMLCASAALQPARP
jgi:hypothetical protein